MRALCYKEKRPSKVAINCFECRAKHCKRDYYKNNLIVQIGKGFIDGVKEQLHE